LAKYYRWWSLLILLLSVAFIRRKLLKTTHIEERCVHTNSESYSILLGSLKNQFNSKQIIQILQPIIIDNTHLYIVDFLIFLIFFKTNISLTTCFHGWRWIFRTFLENMKTSSSLSKILETKINVFESNSQIIKNQNVLDENF